MKIYILALVFAVVQGKEFDVTKDGQVCLLLQLDGLLYLNFENSSKNLNFNNSTVSSNSSCTNIKLQWQEQKEKRPVELWFQFASVSDNWEVTPFVQFIPHDVFSGANETDLVTYTANALEKKFSKKESYQCLSQITLSFNTEAKVNIIVKAQTENLKIQSLNASSFVDGTSCDEDMTSTAITPTIVHTSVPTTAKTTPQPSYRQNFSCTDNSTTKFRVSGYFSLAITYNTTQGKPKTVIIDVPEAQPEVDCSSNSNETLHFKFFDGWSIVYIFKTVAAENQKVEADGKYYISNITVTYVHDSHLPDSNVNTSATAYFSKVDYLEASTKGYYKCNDITLPIDQHVTLTTKEFNYRAFNDKGDIKFSGDVTECPADEDTSSVVPIAVGAALAGLVIIVLIAYIIGRRRSRKAGYESV